MKRESHSQSERHPAQLDLPFTVEPPPAPHTVATPTNAVSRVSAAPPVRSRTRLVEMAIQAALDNNTRVVVTDARSVLLSQSYRKGIRTVRVHQLFLDAPSEVRSALGAYLRDGNTQAGRMIDAFIANQDHLLSYHAPALDNQAGHGNTHDLRPMLRRLNGQYFDSQIEADICWGQTGSTRRKKKRSITLGNYCYRSRRITIHPALDQAFVPVICVERVVHHELCHARHPAEKSQSGRRILHGPAFRHEEARFVGALEADSWIQNNLDRLLRYRSGQCTSVKPPRSSGSRTPSV